MLILITPNHLSEKHYPLLTQALQWVDKLHIKIQYTSQYPEVELQQIIQKILPPHNDTLRKKICIHLNEYFINNPNALKLLQLDNIHLPEKLYLQYKNIIQDNFYHQNNVSASIHHLDIKETYNKFSYLIYGPVFPSISKTNYFPEKTLTEIKKDIQYINSTIDIPIIGVGGITKDNFRQAMDTGFSGIALRGHIWMNDNPTETLYQFINEWKKYKDQ